MKTAGIYIHVPFCRKKCRYCDFYSIADMSLSRRFVDAVVAEMEMADDASLPLCDSLYLGGGTPTVLPEDQLVGLIRAAVKRFRFDPESEITIEANPGAVDARKLAACRAAGANRLNVGVQSFQAEALRFLGRIHTAQDADRTLREARQSGFDTIGLDLIFGLPGQTLASWLADLERALAFEPEHISCYSLTYEPGTGLYQDLMRRRIQALPDARVAGFFEAASVLLTARGYEHYEISNYARGAEYRSRHNVKYWRFAPYLGFGPAAHSFIPPRRWWNPADLDRYLDAVAQKRRPTEAEETLSAGQSMTEAIYLGLRMSDGIGYDRFEQDLGVRFEELFGDLVHDLVEEGMVAADASGCRLTLKGMRFLDSIAGRFIDRI